MENQIESGNSVQKTWRKIVNNYQNPDIRRSIWQLVNTLVPFVILWILMILIIDYSYWLVLPLAFLAGGLVVRLFIFFHDCGHFSFFKVRQSQSPGGIDSGHPGIYSLLSMASEPRCASRHCRQPG